jgi:hypothetical protein
MQNKIFINITAIPAFRAEGKTAEQNNIEPKKERPKKKFIAKNSTKLEFLKTKNSITVTIIVIINTIDVLKIIQAR